MNYYEDSYFDDYYKNSNFSYNYSYDYSGEYGPYDGDIPWFDSPSITETRIVPGIFIAIFAIGVFGNCLVLYVFIRNKPLRTVTNMFLVNLAIVDLVYLCWCIPFNAASLWLSKWPFGDIICKITSFLMVSCMSVSTLTLIAVGVDRYFAIVHPVMSYSCRKSRRAFLEILSIWIICLLSFSPVLKFSKEEILPTVYGERAYCIETLEPEQRKVYTMVVTILFYVIPQIILGFCYVQIARKMRQSMHNQQSQLTAVTLKIRRRVVKMIFVVTLAFAICWLPLHLAAINESFKFSSSVFFYNLRLFAPCFSYFTTAVNPVIYCFLSKTFRKFFQATFTCKKVNVRIPLVGEDAVPLAHNTSNQLVRRAQTTSRPGVESNNSRPLLINVRPAANVYIGPDLSSST